MSDRQHSGWHSVCCCRKADMIPQISDSGRARSAICIILICIILICICWFSNVHRALATGASSHRWVGVQVAVAGASIQTFMSPAALKVESGLFLPPLSKGNRYNAMVSAPGPSDSQTGGILAFVSIRVNQALIVCISAFMSELAQCLCVCIPSRLVLGDYQTRTSALIVIHLCTLAQCIKGSSADDGGTSGRGLSTVTCQYKCYHSFLV